jgi:hypothetical protein
MTEQDLITTLQGQVRSLEELVFYLEDRATLGAEEYDYCQVKLHEVLEQLKRLAPVTESGEART